VFCDGGAATRPGGGFGTGGGIGMGGGTAPYASRSGYRRPGDGAGDLGNIAFMFGVALGGVVARDSA
jgi:hypothetical protein